MRPFRAVRHGAHGSRPLLARHVTPEQPLSLSKFVLLVIPRGSEPENTQAESGPIGDREKGIEYRRMQVEETLTGRGINGMNLLFYDPLHHFDATSENRMKPDSNLAEIQAERDDVWKAFSAAIELREDKVWAASRADQRKPWEDSRRQGSQ